MHKILFIILGAHWLYGTFAINTPMSLRPFMRITVFINFVLLFSQILANGLVVVPKRPERRHLEVGTKARRIPERITVSIQIIVIKNILVINHK